jgi:hypothetical protein
MNGMLVTYTGGNFTPAGHCTAYLPAVVEAQSTCTDVAAQSGAGLGHLIKHIFLMIALTDPFAIRSAFPGLVPLRSVHVPPPSGKILTKCLLRLFADQRTSQLTQ